MSALTLRPRILFATLMAFALAAAGKAPTAWAEGVNEKPTPSPDAQENFAIGISAGAGIPGAWPNLQGNSAVWLRWGGSWHEGMVGLTGRSQALSATRSSVFETSGLQLGYGLRAWNLHAGLSASGELLREIVPNEAAPGQLRFHNGAGVVLEPYLGLDLFQVKPFQVQLMGFWPVWQALKADSVGPRVMVSLWVNPNDKDEGEAASPSPEPEEEGNTSRGEKSVGPEEDAGPEGSPGEIIHPVEAQATPSTRPSLAPSARPSTQPNPRSNTQPNPRPNQRPRH